VASLRHFSVSDSGHPVPNSFKERKGANTKEDLRYGFSAQFPLVLALTA